MSFMLLGVLNSQVDAGAAGAYDLLETVSLASSASSVTFSSIDQSYKHLQIRAVARNTWSGGFTGTREMKVNLNSDTGSNYAWHYLRGEGSAVDSGNFTSSSYAGVPYFIPDNDVTANVFGAAVIDILDYSSASKNTTIRSLNGAMNSSNPRIQISSALWNNTSAVTNINLASSVFDFLAGSRFSLYGIRG